MLTAGTRGDVEPFVALAQSAVGRGHQVRLGVPDHCGVDTTGLDTVSLHMDFAQLISDQGVYPWAMARNFGTVLRPAVGRLLLAAVEHIITFAPDAVVYHRRFVQSAVIAADRIGIPSAVVESIPSLTRSREFPAPYITSRNLGPLNRATYQAASLATLMFRRELEAALTKLPAGPRRRTGSRVSLIPVSPQLLPRPSDWPATARLTGYWAGQPKAAGADAELADFMDSGNFLYAGFGSMKAGDPSGRGELIVNAARRSGLKALIATGWGGLSVSETGHRDVLDPRISRRRPCPAPCHGGNPPRRGGRSTRLPGQVSPPS